MKDLKKYLFQDETGKYVVGQAPNVLVYIAVVAMFGRYITSGVVSEYFDLLFFGAAFAWSYLEIRFGESMFRRIVGGVVLVVIFATRLMQ